MNKWNKNFAVYNGGLAKGDKASGCILALKAFVMDLQRSDKMPING